MDMTKKLWMTLGVIVILGLGGYYYWSSSSMRTTETGNPASVYDSNNTSLAGQPVACTQEVKICPDGTSVGREGPDCAYAQCPTYTTTAS